MKKYTFILSFLLISTNIFGETNIFGHWLTSGSIVKIENCDDYICAKIETLFVEDGVDPKQILDDQNKDKSLRSRPLVGINILDNFFLCLDEFFIKFFKFRLIKIFLQKSLISEDFISIKIGFLQYSFPPSPV